MAYSTSDKKQLPSVDLMSHHSDIKFSKLSQDPEINKSALKKGKSVA